MKTPKDSGIPVRELTHYIRLLLEGDEALRSVWVQGEISNMIRHSSGHVYFTLKDEEAQLAVVMFRSAAASVADFPGNGDKVSVQGDITVYPARGNYQLIAKKIRKEGLGDLHRLFLERKEKLEKEGLFDPSHKKSLPRYPKVIGVATSPTGAVIRDIIQTIGRRYPHVKLLLCPTVVQGDAGSDSICESLRRLEAKQVDLIILARGGGSLEDLWCFNEEAVVRAIYQCKVPVISAVGHETDFSLSDFVADKRAATPTAAAEMAVPESRELINLLSDSEKALGRSLGFFIDFRNQVLDDYQNRLVNLFRNRIEKTRARLDTFEANLHALDMHRVLERGFSVTMKEGKALLSAEELKAGDTLTTILNSGKIISTIENTVTHEQEKGS